MCRLDLRGTGSSSGDATDEYPPEEQRDLVEVIAWLAGQEWCDGGVGMFGTSYSGFNSLQLACERPPALKAVCAIYASDDRWTDDVHWRGGALRLVDLVDYCHYMTPMCVLPPVPAVWGEGWQDEWRRRLETNEPWVLTWLREDVHGDYWRGGSVRLGADGAGYERIDGPDDDRRGLGRRLPQQLLPHRRRAGRATASRTGCWPARGRTPTRRTRCPGPRIDLDVEMAAWFDRWLRAADDVRRRSTRTATSSSAPRPGPSPTSTCTRAAGCGCRRCRRPGRHPVALDGPRSLPVVPDLGTAAWIDCAGHLPWGLSGDQRLDDARSLTWDVDAAGRPGRRPPAGDGSGSAPTRRPPRCRSSSATSSPTAPPRWSPAARSTSPSATASTAAPSPLVPGEEYDVVARPRRVRLRVGPRQPAAGQRRRRGLAEHGRAAGAGRPHRARRLGSSCRSWWATSRRPTFTPGAEHSAESAEGVDWEIRDDVLRRTTHARTRTVSRVRHAVRRPRARGLPRRGLRRPAHVRPDARTPRPRSTWAGRASSAGAASVMDVTVTGDGVDVAIETWARLDDAPVSHRTWRERLPVRPHPAG